MTGYKGYDDKSDQMQDPGETIESTKNSCAGQSQKDSEPIQKSEIPEEGLYESAKKFKPK